MPVTELNLVLAFPTVLETQLIGFPLNFILYFFFNFIFLGSI